MASSLSEKDAVAPARWLPCVVELRCADGQWERGDCKDLREPDDAKWVEVSGYVSSAAKGLAVSESRGGDGFRVTHLSSGYSMGPFFDYRPDAERMALEMAALGDWTRDAAAVLADTDFRLSACEVLRATRARLFATVPDEGSESEQEGSR